MNGMTWQDFVDSIREGGGAPGSYRDRVKPQRLKSDMGKYGVGSSAGSKKAQEGSPLKNVKVKIPADFNKLSAPALEEEVEEHSFDINLTLEPHIWEGDELNEAIARRLQKIAQDFIDNLPVEVDIEDIRLTGSLANYNWSRYSDIDLHVIVNFEELDDNRAMIKSFFDNARMRWNMKHRIRMKGYDVEIYVEDSREQHLSSGIYSILKNEWVKKPSRYESTIDFSAARKKAENIEFQANMINNLITARKFKAAMKSVIRLKQKIKNMRAAGLESRKQEFSIENIAFKILRRNGTLDMLEDLKNKIYDTMLSVKEE